MAAEPVSEVALELDLQQALPSQDVTVLPTRTDLERWVQAALDPQMRAAQLTIRLVGRDESATLNRRYRDRQGPTNVLSFPFEALPEVELPLLGDIVICAPLAADEAAAQGKSQCAHWAHLVVHGVLHLRGYDHIDVAEAREMEDLETEIMAYLGFDDPYREGEAR